MDRFLFDAWNAARRAGGPAAGVAREKSVGGGRARRGDQAIGGLKGESKPRASGAGFT
jgi:hypothetical protein